MFLTPPNLNMLITRFPSITSSRGADPVRIWLRSSPNITSRTQCSRFSIPRWPHQISSNRAASARSGGRLVIAQARTTVFLPWCLLVRSTCRFPEETLPTEDGLDMSPSPWRRHWAATQCRTETRSLASTLRTRCPPSSSPSLGPILGPNGTGIANRPPGQPLLLNRTGSEPEK